MNITDVNLLGLILRTRNKYEYKYRKMKLLPEVSQKYEILKITTFETLLAMPHSQNSIGNSPFLNFQKYLI